MKLQVERLPAPLWMRAIIPILSVFVTFLLTSGFVLLVGANPLQAAYYFLLDPLSNPVRGIEVLVKATPLLMTGAAVAFAFAVAIGTSAWKGSSTWAPRLPRRSACTWAECLPGSPCADCHRWIFSRDGLGIPSSVYESAFENRRSGDHAAAQLCGDFHRQRYPQWPLEGSNLPMAAITGDRRQRHLPRLIPRSRPAPGIYHRHSDHYCFVVRPHSHLIRHEDAGGGVEHGGSPLFGHQCQPHRHDRALISGGIGGLAGASEVAGISLSPDRCHLPGYGYTGIIIATLGSLNAFGVAAAALFIGLVDTGSQTVSRALGVPAYLGDVLQATLLLVTLAMLLLQSYRFSLRRRSRAPQE